MVMQKNANNETGTEMLQDFIDYISENNKISDVISYISRMNRDYGKYLHHADQLTEIERLNIVILYDYMIEEYGSMTYEARMKKWGKEPLFFELAEECIDRLHKENLNNLKQNSSKHQIREAETLMLSILDIPGEKNITSIQREGYANQYTVPAVLLPKEKESIKDLMMFDFLLLITGREGKCIVSSQADKRSSSSEICGFNILPIGLWQPMLADDLEELVYTTPSGVTMQPEDGVKLICRPRERF